MKGKTKSTGARFDRKMYHRLSIEIDDLRTTLRHVESQRKNILAEYILAKCPPTEDGLTTILLVDGTDLIVFKMDVVDVGTDDMAVTIVIDEDDDIMISEIDVVIRV